jgi:hypothetical protein
MKKIKILGFCEHDKPSESAEGETSCVTGLIIKCKQYVVRI